MKKYNKLAMFGGTFSPFHNGHIAALKAYVETVSPDVVYIIPTAIPPHKCRSDSATDEQRLKMIQMSVENLKIGCEIVVSDLEIARGGKSYTIDTVEQLKKIANSVVIYCGTDMVLTLDKWYNFKRLLSIISVAYMQRENDLRFDSAVKDTVERLHIMYGTEFIALPPVSDEISSSMIRKMIQEKEDITGLVDENVAKFIYDQELYMKGELSEQ